jgi:hypothetical protein
MSTAQHVQQLAGIVGSSSGVFFLLSGDFVHVL